MERPEFVKLSAEALEHIDETLGALEHEALDLDLAGDVLTLEFSDGTKFIINSHSAAGQVWMAANNSAWHFDHQSDTDTWVAEKTNDELMATVAREVGRKLGTDIQL